MLHVLSSGCISMFCRLCNPALVALLGRDAAETLLAAAHAGACTVTSGYTNNVCETFYFVEDRKCVCVSESAALDGQCRGGRCLSAGDSPVKRSGARTDIFIPVPTNTANSKEDGEIRSESSEVRPPRSPHCCSWCISPFAVSINVLCV